jgi:hypothetical protein
MRRRIAPDTAARYAEAQAHVQIERERAINRVIKHRNPTLPETDRYRCGALPPSDPRFGSRLDYLRYVAKRTMGRFNPNVRYPTAADGKPTDIDTSRHLWDHGCHT